LTNNFSLICQIRDFGSGQILQPRQFYLSPVPIAIGIAKIAPSRFLCQKAGTQPPHIAGPLAVIKKFL
jgi:hypothetical protein